MTIVPLGGSDWSFKGYLGDDWVWRSAHKPASRDLNHWHPASVPGSVMHDLLHSDLVPDPYVGMNSLLSEWVSQRTWVYKKSFTVPAELKGQQIELVFAGVDYHARFFLNGEYLAEHTGMYTPVCCEVSHLLNFNGDNLLAVVISPAPFEQPQVGYTSRVRTHKSRMTYWWDFCPRMVHQGIWQNVYLKASGPVRLDDLYIRTEINEDYSSAVVSAAVKVSASVPTQGQLRLTIHQQGEFICLHERLEQFTPGGNHLNQTCEIDRPQLWFPNESGRQPLYQARLEVLLDDGRLSDVIETTFAVRKIEFIPNQAADPQALPYTLVVNGQKTYIKGWNWVPIDALYGVPRPEKLNHLLRLAKDAHVNMLRVWGGGLIESNEFYDLCDRLGILVWQEFIQSSSGLENTPPDDPNFINFMAREAEQIIPRLRNHPSLAAWCGGNELSSGDTLPCDEQQPLLAALREQVNRLDPGRAWLPTSPSGKHFAFDLRSEPDVPPRHNHDVHGPWEYQGLEGQYTLYNSGSDSLLHSEFGVEGITNLRTLQAVHPHEHLLPVSLANPTWEHRGAWWLKQKDWERIFGSWDSIETAVKATQFMQYEGLRYAVESDRRRQYHNSGSLPWQFNEPFPMSACTSAVDYFGEPKPAYYAVKQAYQPLHLSARYPRLAWGGFSTFEAEIWYSNSAPDCSGTLQISMVDLSGHRFGAQTLPVECLSNQSGLLYSFRADLAEIKSEVFFLDLALRSPAGDLLAENRILFSTTEDMQSALHLPAARLRVERSGAEIIVTNSAPTAALWVWLESTRELKQPAWAYFEHNYFCLLPGESRCVKATASPGLPADQAVQVKAWNTDSYFI